MKSLHDEEDQRTNDVSYLGLIGERWPFRRDAARAVKACLQGYSSDRGSGKQPSERHINGMKQRAPLV